MLAAGLSGVWVVVAVLAVEDPGNGWLDLLRTGGALGVLTAVLVLIITDKIGPHGERNRLRDQIDVSRATLDAQNESIRRELVPAMIEANRIQAEVIRALDRLSARGS